MTAAVIFLGGVGYTLESTTDADNGVATVYATPAEPAAPVLAVIGDSFTDPDPPWSGPNGWAAQAAAGHGALLVNLAHVSSGYARPGEDGSVFPAQAEQVPADATVVVVWGGYNDLSLPLEQVRAAAGATYAAVHRRAPDAVLVVLSPQWATSAPSAALLALRDALRPVATDAGALWVDTTSWLAGHPELIGPDGLHPNAAAQPYLAGLVGPYLAATLPR